MSVRPSPLVGSREAGPPAAPRPWPAALPRRLWPRPTLKQTSTVLGLIGMMSVVAVTGYMAWNERRVLFAEARDHAEQSAAYLADHAQRLFEVSDLALHASAGTIGARPLEAAARDPGLGDALRRVDDMLPYVDVLFAADAEGRVRITTLVPAPPTYSVADRSVFQQARSQPIDQLLIGEPIVGRMTGRATFIVARRRSAPDGRFDGIVGAAMTLSYFTDYWARLDKRNDEQIALVHLGSGSILAHYPDNTATGPLGTGLAAATASGASAGVFEAGRHAFASFRQVGDLPVAVAVVFSDAVIMRQWHEALWRLLAPAAAVLATLLAGTALARRLARREDVARRQIETARAVLSAANARLEQRVAERTAELVDSNREIQRFAYIVSHDLRAPLVNIMGFTAELQGLSEEVLAAPASLDIGTRERVGQDFKEAFGFILSSIDKMDRLIKAILALSRQGQRVLRPEPLDMDALMRSIADGVAHQAQQCGAAIVLHPLPSLVADRIAVEQIFANLLDNAVKYLRPEVAGRIEISGTASATTVTYAVNDNGRGIDPGDHERVFELFRRAGRQDRPGEGIGLANVRSLVRRLQGTIALDSGPGMGCVFAVTLPKTGAAPGDD